MFCISFFKGQTVRLVGRTIKTKHKYTKVSFCFVCESFSSRDCCQHFNTCFMHCQLRRMDDLCIGPEDSPDTLKVFLLHPIPIVRLRKNWDSLSTLNVAIALGFNVKDLKRGSSWKKQVAYLRVFEFRYFCQRPWRTLLALRGGPEQGILLFICLFLLGLSLSNLDIFGRIGMYNWLRVLAKETKRQTSYASTTATTTTNNNNNKRK